MISVTFALVLFLCEHWLFVPFLQVANRAPGALCGKSSLQVSAGICARYSFAIGKVSRIISMCCCSEAFHLNASISSLIFKQPGVCQFSLNLFQSGGFA